mgnify:CR=1 FL=1
MGKNREKEKRKKKEYQTSVVSVEFNSHRDVTVPRDRVNAERASVYCRIQHVIHNGISIAVTLK